MSNFSKANTKNNSLSLIIIGAQKAGTTALLRLLEQHEDIVTHTPIEFSYFIRDEMYSRSYDDAFKHHYGESSFENKSIVAKSVGILDSEKALQRLYDYNPNIKIAVLLRNPVDRAYSAFWYMRSIGAERAEKFEDVVFQDSKKRFPNNDFMQRSCDYLGKGRYYASLQKVEEYFTREQILLLSFNDLKNEPDKLANKVINFMNLQSTQINVDSERNKSTKIKYKWLASIFGGHNNNPVKQVFSKILPREIKSNIVGNVKKFNKTSNTIPKLNEKTRRKLTEYFKEQNALLAKEYKIYFNEK